MDTNLLTTDVIILVEQMRPRREGCQEAIGDNNDCPADTRRKNNVTMTSKRRLDIASTSQRRHHRAVCPLGVELTDTNGHKDDLAAVCMAIVWISY